MLICRTTLCDRQPHNLRTHRDHCPPLAFAPLGRLALNCYPQPFGPTDDVQSPSELVFHTNSEFAGAPVAREDAADTGIALDLIGDLAGRIQPNAERVF